MRRLDEKRNAIVVTFDSETNRRRPKIRFCSDGLLMVLISETVMTLLETFASTMSG